MFVEAIRLAISKSDDPATSAALQVALDKAQALAQVEAELEGKINASKALRGEGPTKLSRSQRSDVDGHADDARILAAEQLASFGIEPSARRIASRLKSALIADLKFWSNAARHAHPEDLHIVQQFIAAKTGLRDALAQCIKGPD